MKKTAITVIASIAALVGTSTIAQAQDYNNWNNISPWGLEMVDPFGNIYYVDPWAADSQVDIHGNVMSSYNTPLDAPGAGWYDLAPSGGGYLDSNPYAGATDSNDKFLEMIWE
ncbi:MAG: hypothetical protein AAGA22_01225 [Pseudomonadota bacterium]